MAKKCVDHMPQPVAAPAAAIQIARARPAVERARLNSVIAVRLDRKQTTPATTTRRQSCCVVRQFRTRNIVPRALCPAGIQPAQTLANIHLRFVNQTPGEGWLAATQREANFACYFWTYSL